MWFNRKNKNHDNSNNEKHTHKKETYQPQHCADDDINLNHELQAIQRTMRSNISISNAKGEIHWVNENGADYLLDEHDQKLTGWQTFKGHRYYLEQTDGHLLRGWLQFPDGSRYWMGSDGVMKTSWQKLDDAHYYFDPTTGKQARGWQTINKQTYHFNRNSGKMDIGWWYQNGYWYYFAEDSLILGQRQIGPAIIGNHSYYFNNKGQMITGWNKEWNTYHFYDSNGRMLRGHYNEHDELVPAKLKRKNRIYSFDIQGSLIRIDEY